MVHENPTRVEARINRLRREIDEIDKYFYGGNQEKDRQSYMSMLEHKRDDMVRGTVLQLHTAIEELLTDELFAEILGTEHHKYGSKLHGTKGKALVRMLQGGGGLGFEMKLNFGVVAELLDEKTKERLSELNTLRNKCSHNWLLNVPARRKKGRGSVPRLLTFRGRDVHKVAVLKDVIAEYGNIYYRMLARRLRRDDIIRSARTRARRRSPAATTRRALI